MESQGIICILISLNLIIFCLVLKLDGEQLSGSSLLRSAMKRAELGYLILQKLLKCDGELSAQELKTYCTSQQKVCVVFINVIFFGNYLLQACSILI